MAGSKDVWSGGYSEHFQEAVELCQQEGKVADLKTYERGKAEALIKFCTSENGYDWGHSGHQMLNTCPVALATGFMKSYETGMRDFQAAVEATKARGEFSYERLIHDDFEQKLKAENEKRDREKSASVKPSFPGTAPDGTPYNPAPLPSVFDKIR